LIFIFWLWVVWIDGLWLVKVEVFGDWYDHGLVLLLLMVIVDEWYVVVYGDDWWCCYFMEGVVWYLIMVYWKWWYGLWWWWWCSSVMVGSEGRLWWRGWMKLWRRSLRTCVLLLFFLVLDRCNAQAHIWLGFRFRIQFLIDLSLEENCTS
jgi:hypothetical protein